MACHVACSPSLPRLGGVSEVLPRWVPKGEHKVSGTSSAAWLGVVGGAVGMCSHAMPCCTMLYHAVPCCAMPCPLTLAAAEQPASHPSNAPCTHSTLNVLFGESAVVSRD